MTRRIAFTPPPTGKKFMADKSLVRGLMGPVGSGKSSVCCWEIFRRAKLQKVGPDGLRRTRFLIIRNTYAELKQTTLRTFQDWFPPNLFGSFKTTPPMTQTLAFDDVHCELIFLALDRAEDVGKLRSFECTGAWVNEASQIHFEIIRTLTERIGRYPAIRDGGPTWQGIIMDTNPPDTAHWWYQVFEEKRPKGWALYKQPSGRSKAAENTENLPKNYYQNIIDASPTDKIRTMVDGQYGQRRDGFGVFSDLWHPHLHTSGQPLPPPNEHKPIIVGMDFGLTPAAVFLQQDARGVWYLYTELVAQSMMGAEQFAPLLKDTMAKHFSPKQPFVMYGDPAGAQRSQADARTAFDVLRGAGLMVRPAPVQNLSDRLESVRHVLSRRLGADKNTGGLVVGNAPYIRAALAGDYKYQSLKTSDGLRPTPQPDKNDASHIADALQYGLTGGGEWQNLKNQKRGGAVKASLDFTI